MVFPAGGATMIDRLEHVDKGDKYNTNSWLAYRATGRPISFYHVT